MIAKKLPCGEYFLVVVKKAHCVAGTHYYGIGLKMGHLLTHSSSRSHSRHLVLMSVGANSSLNSNAGINQIVCLYKMFTKCNTIFYLTVMYNPRNNIQFMSEIQPWAIKPKSSPSINFSFYISLFFYFIIASNEI